MNSHVTVDSGGRKVIRTGLAWFVPDLGLTITAAGSELEHTTTCRGQESSGSSKKFQSEGPAARTNETELPEFTVNGLRFMLFGSGPGLYDTLPRNRNWRLPLTPNNVFLTTIVTASGAGLTAK